MKQKYFKLIPCLALVAIFAVTGCSRQSKADRAIVRAQKEVAAGKLDRAEIEYLNALRYTPGNAKAAAALGDIYVEQGKLAQAVACFQAVVSASPGDEAAAAKLAQLLRLAGQFAKAREQAASVLDKNPANTEALLALVESSRNEQDIKDAFARLDRLPEAMKAGFPAVFAKGTLLLSQGSYPAAEAEFAKAVALDPKSDRAHLALGQVLLQRGDLDKAEKEFTAAAELAPLRSPTRILLARFKLQSGKTEEAIALVNQITEKAPDYVPAKAILAQAAFAQNHLTESSNMVKEVLSLDPINYDGLKLRAKLMLSSGDVSNAVTHFEKILETFGPTPEHHYNLAIASLKNGQESKALENLEAAIRGTTNFLDAIYLRASILLNQGNAVPVVTSLNALLSSAKTLPRSLQARLPEACQLLARAYIAQNNTAAAVNALEMMRAGKPADSPFQVEAATWLTRLRRTNEAAAAYLDFVKGSTNSYSLLLAGHGLTYLRQFADAQTVLERAAELSPKSPEVLAALVSLETAQGRFPEANARLQKQIAANPSDAFAYYLVGRTSFDQAMSLARSGAAAKPQVQPYLDQAEKSLQKSIELNPDLPAGYNLLAEVLVAAGKQEEALQRLGTIAAKMNDLPTLLLMATIQTRLGKTDEAAKSYEKVIELNPKSAEALNNLAGIYAADPARLDRALTLARQAREAAKGAPAVADTLGWVLYQRGEYAEAAPLLEEAAQGLPDNTEVLLHLGMNAYMLGQEQKALSTLERAAAGRLDPEHKASVGSALSILQLDPAKAPSGSVEMLKQRLAKMPRDVVAWKRLAEIYRATQAWEPAAQAYESLLKQAPGNAQAALNLARLYADRLSRADKALEMARTARSLAPTDPEIAHLLGRLAYTSGDTTWALSLLEESARRLPQDPSVAYDLGLAKYAAGQVADAKARMELAAKTENFAQRADAAQFVTLLNAGADPATASQFAAEARKALAQHPKLLPALFVVALDQQGTGDFAGAAKGYESILAAYPGFSPATRELALLYFEKLNQEPKAAELASKAREAFRDDPRLAKVLGVSAAKKADYSRAASLLKEAAPKLAQDPEVFYYLGLAHFQLKAKSDARQALQKALDLKLADNLASEARKLLGEL